MANKSDDGRAEQSTEQRTQAWHHRPVPVPVPVPVPIVVPVAVTVPVSVAVPASDGGQFGGPNRRHCTPPSLFPPTRSQFDPHAVRQTGKYGGIGASGHRRCLCLVCKPEHGHRHGHGHESGLSCFCNRWHFIVVAESELRCVAALLFAVLLLLLLLLVPLFLCCCCCGG